MVRVTVLASGSKGNCTIVATNRTRIALDAGLSCREIVKRMRRSGEEPEKLSAILITHEHQDHVQGLSALARRWKLPVYVTPDTHAAWKRWVDPPQRMSFQEWLKQRKEQAAASEPTEAGSSAGEPRESETRAEAAAPVAVAEQHSQESSPAAAMDDPTYLPCVEHFRAGIPFEIGDIRVRPFTIPHDAADPVGFLLEAEGVRIAVATDLGYMPPNVVMHLKGADLLMLESNHDVEMLRDGPYPWSVKQRVLSRVGHLSNDAVGDYLSGEYDGAAQYIVLAHLSESNNLPELAHISAERPLVDKMGLLASKVLLASQTDPLESIWL
jgi:phosphoribosyl 1,2-cyclic phosphodiesterase